jgi:hypothetical protein
MNVMSHEQARPLKLAATPQSMPNRQISRFEFPQVLETKGLTIL